MRSNAPSPKTGSGEARRGSWKLIALLQLCVFLFSLSSVVQKIAARHPLFSWNWILLYGLSVGIIGVYAIAWQQFLKRLPLTTAYANRSMTMLWGMVWGALLFHETISWNMILGVAVIAVGIYFVVTGDAE